MKRKALLAGFMSVSLAFSSLVVPAGAYSALGKLTGGSMMTAYADEVPVKISIEGMDGEKIRFFDSNGDVFDEANEEDPDAVYLPVKNGEIEIDSGYLESKNNIYFLQLSLYNTKYNNSDYEFVVDGRTKETADTFAFKIVNGELVEYNKEKSESTGRKFTSIKVKKLKYEHKWVPLNSFEVVYYARCGCKT